MNLLSTILAWTQKALATWSVAAIVGGVLILIAERLDRRREPSDADVRRTAENDRSGTASGRSA